jgi:hypothetical protein
MVCAATIAIGSAISVTTTVAIASAIAITAVAMTTSKPRTGTDEDPAVKPRWAIIAVRCAGIRRIVIVTVGTDWRGIPIIVISTINWAANTYPD